MSQVLHALPISSNAADSQTCLQFCRGTVFIAKHTGSDTDSITCQANHPTFISRQWPPQNQLMSFMALEASE